MYFCAEAGDGIVDDLGNEDWIGRLWAVSNGICTERRREDLQFRPCCRRRILNPNCRCRECGVEVVD